METNPVYFYDTADFAWVKNLEVNWQLIRHELDQIITQPASDKPNPYWKASHPDYVKSDQPIAWKTYGFLFFGIRQQSHCNACPETWRLLSQIPGLTGAEFSMMEPGTHITPHKGYTRMVLRSHIGLIIPQDAQACALRVGDQTRHWEEGKVMIFDDSYEHEAWNRSSERRAVLMFDIANPEMGYTADQICRYKLGNVSDPFMLGIAPTEKWMEWYEQGYVPEDLTQ